MKIVYFIRDISDCGGIQQTTCHIINSLMDACRGYDISIVSLYNKNHRSFFCLKEWLIQGYNIFR